MSDGAHISNRLLGRGPEPRQLLAVLTRVECGLSGLPDNASLELATAIFGSDLTPEAASHLDCPLESSPDL